MIKPKKVLPIMILTVLALIGDLLIFEWAAGGAPFLRGVVSFGAFIIAALIVHKERSLAIQYVPLVIVGTLYNPILFLPSPSWITVHIITGLYLIYAYQVIWVRHNKGLAKKA